MKGKIANTVLLLSVLFSYIIYIPQALAETVDSGISVEDEAGNDVVKAKSGDALTLTTNSGEDLSISGDGDFSMSLVDDSNSAKATLTKTDAGYALNFKNNDDAKSSEDFSQNEGEDTSTSFNLQDLSKKVVVKVNVKEDVNLTILGKKTQGVKHLLVLKAINAEDANKNNNIGFNLKDALSQKDLNKSEAQNEATVNKNGIVNQSQNKAIVKSKAKKAVKSVDSSDLDLQVNFKNNKNLTDGTSAFDDNDEPGYDSSATNHIVRSFDSVTYMLPINLGSISGNTDIDTVSLEIDGTITGMVKDGSSYVNLAKGTTTVNGDVINVKQTINTDQAGLQNAGIPLIVNVLGAPNGMKMHTDITVKVVKINGEAVSGVEKKVSDIDDITVSSKPNVTVQVNGTDNGIVWNESKFYGTADTKPSKLGYAFTMFYKAIPLPGRGTDLRGSAYPSGTLTSKITFDDSHVAWDNPNTEDVNHKLNFADGSDIMPKLTAVMPLDTANTNGSWGNKISTNLNYGQKVVSSFYTGQLSFAPASSTVGNGLWNKRYDWSNAVWNSGTYTFTQDSKQINLTNKGFEIGPVDVRLNAVSNNGTLEQTNGNAYGNSKPFSSQGMLFSLPNEYGIGGKNNPNGSNNTLTYNIKVSDIKATADDGTVTNFDNTTNMNLNIRTLRAGKYIGAVLWNKHTLHKNNRNTIIDFPIGNATNGPTGYEGLPMGNTPAPGLEFWTHTETAIKDPQVLLKWNNNVAQLDSGLDISGTNARAYWGIQNSGYTNIDASYYSTKFGVSKVRDNSLAGIMGKTKDDYDWYDTLSEAGGATKVNAVLYSIKGNDMLENSEAWVPLEMVAKKTGEFDQNGDPNVGAGILYGMIGDDTEVRQLTANTNFKNISTYNPDGTVKQLQSPTGQGVYYNNLYVSGLQTLNTITSDATTYNSNETVNWTYKPTINVPTDITFDDTVTMKITLPKGVAYEEDSASMLGSSFEPSITQNADGSTTLTFTKDIGPGKDNKFGNITFKTKFNPLDIDYENMHKDLTITAVISALHDITQEKYRTSKATITVIATNQLGYQNKITSNKIDVNSNYTISYKPFTQGLEVKNYRGLFNLPEDGDKYGSKFSGTTALKGIKISNPDKIKVWLSETKQDALANPNAIDLTTGGWVEFTNQTDLSKFKSVIIQIPDNFSESDRNFDVDFEMTTSGNKASDVYASRMVVNTETVDYKQVFGQKASNVVVQRAVSGYAFKDIDLSNNYTTGDKYLANVPVKLYTKDALGNYNVVSKSLTGEDFTTKVTGADGSYIFSNLASGDYYVGFDASKLGLNLVSYNVGTTDISSKVNTDAKGGVYYTDKIVANTTDKMTLNSEEYKYNNIGLYEFGSLDAKKSVLDSNGTDINGKAVKAGDVITYNIDFSNPIAETLVKNGKITDKLASNLTYVDGSATLDGKAFDDFTVKDGTYTFNVGNVANPTKHTLSFKVKVNGSVDSFSNTAVVSGDDVPSVTPPTVSNTIPPAPVLSKSVDKTTVKLNDVVKYTVKISNDKTGGLWKGVNIIDTFADKNQELVNDSFEITLADGSVKKYNATDVVKDGVITVPAGDLKAGESATLTFEAKIKTYAEAYYNDAIAKGSNADSNADHVDINSLNKPTTISMHKDVFAENSTTSIDKTDVKTNHNITYQLTVKNNTKDGSVSGLEILDSLPDSVSYVPSTLTVNGKAVADSNLTNGKLDIKGLSLAKGESVIVRFNVKVLRTSKDVFKNVAKANGIDDATNGKLSADSNEVSNTTTPMPNLAKTANVKVYNVGDVYTYSIDLSNAKDSGVWRNVNVSDVLDSAHLTLVANSTKLTKVESGKTTTVNVADADAWKDGVLGYKVGDILEGDDVKLTFDVKVKAWANAIVNTANAQGDNATPPSSDVTIKPAYEATDIKVTKQVLKGSTDVNGKQVNTNDILTYVLNVNNTTSKGILNNVVLTDAIPSSVKYMAGSLTSDGKVLDDANVKGDDLTVNLGTLGEGKTIVVKFNVKVNRDALESFSNKANVKGLDVALNEERSNTSNEVKNSVKPEPTLHKEASVTEANVNDDFTYTITAKNAQNAGAWKDVIVKDKLDAEHLTYVPNSTKVVKTVNGKETTEALADADVWANNILAYNAGDVLEGDSYVITFKVKILHFATKITNVVTGGEETPPSTVVVKNANAPTKLKVVKDVLNEDGVSIDGETVATNSTITYKMTVENSVKVNTLTIEDQLVDTLPDNLEPNKGSVKVNGKAVNADDVKFDGNKMTVSLGNIKEAEVKTVTVDAKVKNTTEGKFQNYALVTGIDASTASNIAETSNIVSNDVKPEPVIVKSVSKEDVKKGDSVDWTLKVSNKANKGVLLSPKVVDALPKGLSYNINTTKVDGVLQKDDDIWSNGTLTINLAKMTESSEHTITFSTLVEDVPGDGRITNVGVFSGLDDAGKELSVNDDASINVSYNPSKVTSVKSVLNEAGEDINNKEVKVGDKLTYKILVSNPVKNSVTKDLVVKDDVPYGINAMAVTGLTINGKTADAFGAHVSYSKDDEGKGKIYITFSPKIEDDFNYEISYSIIANKGDLDGVIKNTQTTTGKDGDGKEFNLSNSVQNFIKPQFVIKKEVSKHVVKANEDLVYTLKVISGNGADLHEAKVIDNLPTNLSYKDLDVKVDGKLLGKQEAHDLYAPNVEGNKFEAVGNFSAKSEVDFVITMGVSDSNKGEEFKNQFSVETNGKFGETTDSNIVTTVKNPVEVVVKGVETVTNAPKEVQANVNKVVKDLATNPKGTLHKALNNLPKTGMPKTGADLVSYGLVVLGLIIAVVGIYAYNKRKN